MPTPDPKQRISVINALRAFAALAVAWGHFVAGQSKWLSPTGKYGYLGVDIFFVISGFVIPWSLYRSRYALRDYGRFMLKRNIRLYPPYLASIAISILATNFIIEPLFKIPHMTVTGSDLLLHFTYLNDMFHVPWINVVYWTLAIEFQWYLLVGLVMPMLASPRRWMRFLITSAMVLAYFSVYWDRLVFHYLPVFLIGVFVFQYRAEIIDMREMLGLIAVMVFDPASHLRLAGAAGSCAHRAAHRLLHLPQQADGSRRRYQLLALPHPSSHRREPHRHDVALDPVLQLVPRPAGRHRPGRLHVGSVDHVSVH